MELIKVVKKQLILDLDKNEAPTAWRWRIDRFIRHDDDSEQIVAAEVAATAEDVSAHIGAAVSKQAADIESDRREREQTIAELSAKAARAIADRDSQLAVAAKLNEGLAERLTEAETRLASIAKADAQYDATVKPLFAQPETRQ